VALAAGSPTLRELLLGWSISPLPLVGVVLMVCAYVVGIRRLRLVGRHWSRVRTACFMSGGAVVLLALESGLAAYDDRYFTFHVAQHLLLSMVGPPLLALGAPVTLALQAGSRRTQERLLRVLHCRPVVVVTHPLVAWLLFAGSMFVLYFSNLYALSLRNPMIHDMVHVHFLFVGMLFFWPVVGLDPTVWRLNHGVRLLYVFVALPFHAFLGVALLSGNEPLFAAHTLSDQHAGAGILWAVGDLLSLATVAVVLTQWKAHDDRESAREDRRLDAARVASEVPAAPG
jgi:putative membrane protein